MAISAFIPAARALATKVASNPAVQDFGKKVMKEAAGIAVDTATARLTSGSAPLDGLARRTAPRAETPPRQDNAASAARRSNATSTLALLKAARHISTLAVESAEHHAASLPVAASPGSQAATDGDA